MSDAIIRAKEPRRCALYDVFGCRQPAIQRHHIWPRSFGGPNFRWNLVYVCPGHHKWIHRPVNLERAMDLGLLRFPRKDGHKMLTVRTASVGDWEEVPDGD